MIVLLSKATVCAEQFFAVGWVLNTTVLPAEIIAMALLMIVDVGFVQGVMEPMTP
jgi:hypothetical protein